MKILRYLFCLILICFIQSSLSLASLELQEDQKILLQAYTRLFHHYLSEIKKDLEKHNANLTIFICYALPNEIEDTPQLNTLAYDLIRSGIKESNLYYKLRPGGVTIHQHASYIFNVDKVIVVGSSKLKEDYEKQKGGRGHTSQIIENLLTRINKKGTEGIIPLWFEGRYEENFPETFASLPHKYLGKDYFLSFFDLLANLHPSEPYSNNIQTHKANFDRQRGAIPQNMLARYGEKLLQYQQEQAAMDRAKLESIFLPLPKEEKPTPRPWRSITDKVLCNLSGCSIQFNASKFIESSSEHSQKSYLTLIWEGFHKLHSAMTAQDTSAEQVVICGMGGVGKSYLALAYACEARNCHAYDFIYWINSETEEGLLRGYKGILKKLDLLKGLQSSEDIIDAVNEGLSHKKKWLLIYDNVPTPSFFNVNNKLPEVGGNILLTSRYTKGWRNKDNVINVDIFRPEDSVNYFMTNLSLEPTESNKKDAFDLADALGHLPLALSHAASYITHKDDTMKEYLKKFSEEPGFIFKEDPDNPDTEISYKHIVAKTLALALAGWRISPLGHNLMEYFAYLDSDFIVVNDFLQYAKSEDDLKENIAELANFSLIKRNPPFVSIHRLVQFVIRAEQEDPSDNWQDSKNIKKGAQQITEELCNLFIKKAKEAFGSHERISREDAFKYLPHILALLEHTKRLHINFSQLNQFEWVGKIFYSIGLFMKLTPSRASEASSKRDKEKLKHLLERGENLFGSPNKEGDLKALEPLLEITNQGNSSAQTAVGYLFDTGLWIPQNDIKAFQWYTKGAEQGEVRAQNNLGVMYTDGRGVEKDGAKAVEWYTKAAEQGYAVAQFNLGIMYAEGLEVAKDEAKAIEWYSKAAEQGYAGAQFNLGIMYAEGRRGVAQNEAKAIEWYTKAAEQGYAKAQFNLGIMYESGRSVEKDMAKAVEWCTKAAEQGYAGAQFNLGIMYTEGRGVALDEAKAIEWYSKAAEQGFAKAQNCLGWLHENWCGTSLDQLDNQEVKDKRAVEWYTKAAGQGNAMAQYNLAWMYENGFGVSSAEKDIKAQEWYKKAADQGHDFKEELSELRELGDDPGSLYHLGWMYEKGRGVEPDINQARDLYKKAAAKGHQRASLALKVLEDAQKELSFKAS
jgi:TPR repeat protein